MRKNDLAHCKTSVSKLLGCPQMLKGVQLLNNRTGVVAVHVSSGAVDRFGIGPIIRGTVGDVIETVEQAVTTTANTAELASQA